jgi:putrescine transport system permease protein
MKKGFSWLTIVLILGLFFLYAPILVMVVYSFNASPLVNIWGGWSLSWYQTLFQDTDVLSAAWLSIRIAVSASTCAVILGTMTAIAIKRYGPFRGKTFLYGMTVTPLVMPDIVTGLSLLLMFVGLNDLIGWPSSHGFNTILMAHITFCTAYATIVIQARLGSLDHSIEEAAMDLGAKPIKTFFWITLPQITTSLIAAWLLSFTLSIDDLVITSFVSGPGSTTLPMYIYSTVRAGVTPEINALATIMITIVATIVLLGLFFATRWKKD